MLLGFDLNGCIFNIILQNTRPKLNISAGNEYPKPKYYSGDVYSNVPTDYPFYTCFLVNLDTPKSVNNKLLSLSTNIFYNLISK